jgi:hypothetical protein
MPSATALGNVVSINNSIIVVAGDAAVAAGWQGTDNGTGPDLAGSDWEGCFRALYTGGNPAPVVLPRAEGSLLAFHIDVGGWVRVFRHDDGTVALTEVAFEEDEAEEDPAFLWYAAGPLDAGATEVGTVEVPSGALAILPAPSSGAAIPGAVAIGGGEFCDGAETGLVVTGAAPRYRLWIEPPVEASWGGGARALLVPER